MSNGDTVQVYNPQGVRGTIPSANLNDAKAAGYMAVDETVVAIHPKTGQRGFIPRSNWEDASKAGYIMAPEQQIGEERGKGMHETAHPRLVGALAPRYTTGTAKGREELGKVMGADVQKEITRADKVAEAERKRSFGQHALDVAMIAGGLGVGGAVARALPSAARAGETLETVAQAMRNTPVSVTRAAAAADRAASVIARGGKSSKLITDFIRETIGSGRNTLFWQEARDFLSNAKSRSRLAELFEGQTGHARYAIGEFVESLGEEVMDAARQAGQGKAYAQALKEYRHAKQISRALKAGAIAGGTYVLYKMDAMQAKSRVSQLLRELNQ